MNYNTIGYIFGVLLMAYSITMLPPMMVGLWYGDGGVVPFLCGFAVTFSVGLIIWAMLFRRKRRELRAKDGFFIVSMFWTVLAFFGAVPLYLFQEPSISFTDSFFEAVSGLTTTGATVLTGLDTMPKSLLYYRQQMQWLGGMGIIVLAVAILPMLGVGGMQLYKAEIPGPVKDSKLTPRITETAKALWYIYLILTIICSFCYWLAGMTPFDAIGHGFSTIATGGLSTHDASIGYFESATIETICIVFMLISSLNYGLHFAAWQTKGLRHYMKDAEMWVFFNVLLFIVAVSTVYLWLTNTYTDPIESFRFSIFEAVAITTSTGFGTANFAAWPSLIITLLFLGSFMGDCAGSTAGGIKVIRVWLVTKLSHREIRKLMHPASVSTTKIGRKPVGDRIIEAISGYIGAYIVVFTVLLLCVMATGLDLVTGFSATAASLNNLGPGLGDVAAHYGDIPGVTKYMLCLGMLLGRLEIFPILIIMTPSFWRS